MALSIASLTPLATAQPSSGSLIDKLEARLRKDAPGYRPASGVSWESLKTGESVVQKVRLVAGRCYRVYAESAGTVDDLDLWIGVSEEALTQADTSRDGHPKLGVDEEICPKEAIQWSVGVRMSRGYGAVAWQLVQSAGQPHKPRSNSRYPVGGTKQDWLGKQLKRLHREKTPHATAVVDRSDRRLGTSNKTRFTMPLISGRCYFAVAVAEPSARAMSLAVNDPYGHRTGQTSRTNRSISYRFCSSVSGRWTSTVRMQQGYGTVAFQVFEAR